MEDKYETVKIIQESSTSGVFNLIINRPSVSNALSLDFFAEFPRALHALDRNPNVSVVVLSGVGNHFCGGLDLKSLAAFINDSSGDHGRIGERLRRQIKFMQDAITAIERCQKPVIVAIHDECRGTGVGNIVTEIAQQPTIYVPYAAIQNAVQRRSSRFKITIRYDDPKLTMEGAIHRFFFRFQREVDVAIAADMGTLQRLPGIVGFGNAMELSLTARRFSGEEAKELGLVSRVFGSREELNKGVRTIAEGIGGKPPLAVVGTKAVLIRSRDLNLEQGLEYVATWNSSMLLSDDLTQAISAQKHKRKPTYAKL